MTENNKKCKFCGKKIDGKLILRDTQLCMKNGSDITLCSECMNLYANQEYDKLTKRLSK